MSEPVKADKQSYREAMSRLGAAVNIITTHGASGNAGLTASAVCSVTDDPPTLLVCINRNSKSNVLFKENKNLCVNVLAHEHQELSPIFAGAGDLPMADRFALSVWRTLETGAAALESASACFDCTIDQITEVGTHSVFFCNVRMIYLGASSSGLIYHGRAYHTVSR